MPQSALHDLQDWMASALVFPRRVNSDTLADTLAPSARLNERQRLGIYQRSYELRLLKCMREQFPALCHALGEDLFNDFAVEYLRACPSQSYTLYDLGKRFPGYLQETRPDNGQSEAWVEFMIQLASFELQLFLMFDAPGHEGRPFADADTPEEQLVLQPCFALGEYDFPVATYYHDVRKGLDPVYPAPEKSMLAMLRTNYLTRTLPLSRAHFVFLTAMATGSSVSESLCAVAQACAIPLPAVVQSWRGEQGMRRTWLELGLFIAKNI